jgi:exosome complex exonuclease DIS3/RRP44
LDSESLNPTDVQSYALFEANAVVEEFMLLANVTVAKKILRHYPTLSILRRHPSPNRAMFDGLISKAKSRGFVIDIEDSKRLADSLDAAVDQADPYINKLLRILSTRCMSPAQYFCSGEFRPQEWHHYGLAAPVYTHFTSPIRRYADVCVHRLLAAAIGVAPLPPHLSSKTYLHDLAANMNRRHRAAQLAGRASVQLHTLIFFSEAGKQEEDAYVLDVDTTEGKVPSFAVMVPRYGIEVKVKLPVEADDPSIQRLPSEHKVMVQKSNYSRSIKVFDKVRVQITVVELENHHRELVVELLDEKSSNPAPVPSSGEKRTSDNTAQAETSRPIKKGRS